MDDVVYVLLWQDYESRELEGIYQNIWEAEAALAAMHRLERFSPWWELIEWNLATQQSIDLEIYTG
jgi:hypothetical protein